jgi:uncharacterized protein
LNCFIDTSALIKNYVNERGTEEIAALLESAEKVLVSPVTFIECASALSRLHKSGLMSASQMRQVLMEIEQDTAYFDRIPFDTELEASSVRVSLDHNLRALDSIQLASALTRKREIHRFVSSDRNLLNAAKGESFHVEDPAA